MVVKKEGLFGYVTCLHLEHHLEILRGSEPVCNDKGASVVQW